MFAWSLDTVQKCSYSTIGWNDSWSSKWIPQSHFLMLCFPLPRNIFRLLLYSQPDFEFCARHCDSLLSPLSSLLSRLSLSLISLASMSRWLFIANLPIVSWLSIYLHIFLTICPSTSLPINLCTDEISISDVNRHKTSLPIIYMYLEVYCYKCIC